VFSAGGRRFVGGTRPATDRNGVGGGQWKWYRRR
jgi:hypothetical protein